jgi:hypothetical protein
VTRSKKLTEVHLTAAVCVRDDADAGFVETEQY